MCSEKNPAGKSADTAVIGGKPLQQKSSDMTPRELEEYSALRATIRERGTARVWVALAGLAIWAALTIATAALASLPVATLLPLLVLSAAFEIVFALHTGVERIGRYLQVVFEGDEGGGWEHYAMEYGRQFGSSGCDALFSPYFAAAAGFNFVPVLLAGPVPLEWALVGSLHLLFLLRIIVARRPAASQRATDLERFRHLQSASHARHER